MDIDQMVSDLMKAERMPMNKLTQQKQLLEWKRDDYRDLNKLLTDFRNLSFDMTLQRNYSQKQVTSSNTKVSASASSTAANASYTIADVQLATVASNSTNTFVKAGNKLDASKTIWEQRGVFENFATKTQTQVISDGTMESIDLGGKVDGATIQEIFVQKPGDATPVSYEVITTSKEAITGNQVYLNEETGELFFEGPLENGTIVEEFKFGSFNFNFSMTTYNQAGDPVTGNFLFDGNSTMDDIISEINASNLGVTAFFDEQSNTFMLSKREAGTFKGEEGTAEIEFSGDFLTEVLKFDSSSETGGDPAQVTINGVATTRNSNTFSVNGVTFTLNGDMPGESAVISVNNDTDKTFDAIKNYVEKYNELISKINEKTSQAVYRDYKPLTSEERESLSEKQIEIGRASCRERV